MRKIITFGVTLLLTVSLSLATFAVQAPTPKEENIYAVLAPDGTIEEIYVVNSFKGGAFIDYGDYQSVVNLTDAEPLKWEAGQVSLDTLKQEFYYQGTLKELVLPWNFKLKYLLNQTEVNPLDLIGASGDLTIIIETTPNLTVDPIFFENFILQISVTLDTELVQNISAPAATIASAGKNKVLAFTALPNKSNRFILSAEVHDFEMESIQLTALPFNMEIDLPATDEMISEMGQLTNAISSLNTGINAFTSGVKQTYLGSKQLSSGSEAFAAGLHELSVNSPALLAGSGQIKNALSEVATAISENLGELDFSDLAQLPPGLRQMADGLTEIASGMDQLSTGYTLAYGTLKTAINLIPSESYDLSFLELSLFVAQKENLRKAVNGLIAYYNAAQGVKTAHNLVKDTMGSMSDYLTEMSSGIKTIRNALNEIASSIDAAMGDLDVSSQLNELVNGMNELASNYRDFHLGLTTYFAGVDDLDTGYQQLNDGIKQLAGGLKELDQGGQQLSTGSSLLNKETVKLPQVIKEKISELMAEFDKSDYIPKSFVSKKNQSVTAVQFVIKTTALSKDAPTTTPEIEATHPSFWEKLIDLFSFIKFN